MARRLNCTEDFLTHEPKVDISWDSMLASDASAVLPRCDDSALDDPLSENALISLSGEEDVMEFVVSLLHGSMRSIRLVSQTSLELLSILSIHNRSERIVPLTFDKTGQFNGPDTQD